MFYVLPEDAPVTSETCNSVVRFLNIFLWIVTIWVRLLVDIKKATIMHWIYKIYTKLVIRSYVCLTLSCNVAKLSKNWYVLWFCSAVGHTILPFWPTLGAVRALTGCSHNRDAIFHPIPRSKTCIIQTTSLNKLILGTFLILKESRSHKSFKVL